MAWNSVTPSAGKDLSTVVVNLKAAQKLRRHDPWCYRTEVLEAPPPQQPGAVVWVVDPQRNPVGQAFWATRSPLALRLLTREGPAARPVNEAFFRERIQAALVRRQIFAQRDAYRLIQGESDLLPGLLADRYGSTVVIQTLAEGADVRKAMFGQLLVELTGATQVICRDDHSGRDFEKLPREVAVLHGPPPSTVTFHEGDNAFQIDPLKDMKTGSFLDQVDNHLRAGELARGEALDCFSYHGGFALALAKRCESVLAVEQDEKAAARATDNAKTNGRDNVRVQQGNAFDVLRGFDREGRKFDCIVVDPPGLAKRKEGLQTALRAYRELNVRALKCLRPDGLLVTCSCSGKVTREAFERMVLSAAEDAKRAVQVLERRGAGLDHPVLATLPDTEYLKVLFVRAL